MGGALGLGATAHMLDFASSEIHRGIPQHVGGIGAVVEVAERRVRGGGALVDAGEGEIGLAATSRWLWEGGVGGFAGPG
jgi:hypothetical protein